jgi:hypothetical protein
MPVHTKKARGGVEVSLHSFLISITDEVMQLASRPLAFYPWGKETEIGVKCLVKKK